jgi:hypothetical protein
LIFATYRLAQQRIAIEFRDFSKTIVFGRRAGTKKELGANRRFVVQAAACHGLGRFWREETFTSTGTIGACVSASIFDAVRRGEGWVLEPRIGPLKSA